MKIPQGAGLLHETTAYIQNKYSGKEHLTREEAIDLINHLSGMLLVDDRFKRDKGDSDARYTRVQ